MRLASRGAVLFDGNTVGHETLRLAEFDWRAYQIDFSAYWSEVMSKRRVQVESIWGGFIRSVYRESDSVASVRDGC